MKLNRRWKSWSCLRVFLYVGISFLALVGNGFLAESARGALSLSEIPQHPEAVGNTDPLADKTKPAFPVSVVEIKENLPEAGKFYHMTIQPGKGGYPGMMIGFDHPVDFSPYEMLAVWFKSDTPVSYFRIVPHGADGVIDDFDLAGPAAGSAAFVKPGVWQLALIPFKSNAGWVRDGIKMDWTKIKAIYFYVEDGRLSPSHPPYNFEMGGMALCKLDEAKIRYEQTLIRPAIHTAARISSGKEVSVWTADAGEKIFKDTACPKNAPSVEAACAKAAGHEYASLIWVVRPSRDLKGIEAETGDLTSDAGPLPAADIKVRYVDYIDKQFLSFPDPLPLLNGKGLTAEKDKNLIIWATVSVPPGTPKGIYHGHIILKDAAGLKVPLPIQLQVYGFSLPVENHLKSVYTLSTLCGGAAGYGPEWVQKESKRYWGQDIQPFSKEYITMLKNVIRDYGEHRITPELYRWMDFLSDDDRMALHRQYGFDPIWTLGYNFVFNGYLDAQGKPRAITPAERAANIRALKAAAQKYKAAGEIKLTFIKIADEPPLDPVNAKPVILCAEDVKAAIPEVQSFVTITSPHLPESLYGLINTWCPVWNVFDFDSPQARERKAAGDRFWTYAGEYRSQDAYEPMDLRVLYWLYWKYGITGVHFSHDQHSVFLTYPNNTYPHSDGLEEIPSIRFEMIGHGIQDYEYLWVLRDLIQKNPEKGEQYKALLEIPKDLAENDKNYNRNPQILQNRRNQVAQAIEKLAPPSQR